MKNTYTMTVANNMTFSARKGQVKKKKYQQRKWNAIINKYGTGGLILSSWCITFFSHHSIRKMCCRKKYRLGLLSLSFPRYLTILNYSFHSCQQYLSCLPFRNFCDDFLSLCMVLCKPLLCHLQYFIVHSKFSINSTVHIKRLPVISKSILILRSMSVFY